MYLQITDHCNMTCAHCGYSCSPRKRNFMSKETLRRALKIAGEYGDSIVIGGGEPTTHPEFWEFFGMAVGQPGVEYVWMATNGKIANTAIALAGLAYGSERFGVALSQDAFHEPINPDVINAFRNSKLEIRDVTDKAIAAGRAKRTMVWSKIGCICEETTVDMHGEIWSCGCKKLSLGNVNNKRIDRFDRYMHGHDDLVYAVGECLFMNSEGAAHNRRVVRWLKRGGDA